MERKKEKGKAYPLNQSPLYRLTRKSRLAQLVGLSAGDLQRLARGASSAYSDFTIPKKSGELRPVENPSQSLKQAQARLAKLLSRIQPPDYLFCPVKGRSYVSNAKHHAGNRVVRCLDIRKYFPNTPERRVYWFFHDVMQCEPDVAATLAKIACRDGRLPTGSPLSPIMAYFAYYDVWENIARICQELGYTLSVYIDDVTISGTSVTSEGMWRIKRAIHASGLRYHKEKHYVDEPAEITGVIVANGTLRVPNRQHRKFDETRRALKAARSSKQIQTLRDQLTGLVGQMNHVLAIRE